MGQDFKDIFGDWEPSPDDDPGGEPENGAARDLDEKAVTVVGVFEHTDPATPGSGQTFVLLQDDRARKVPIWIGKFEAVAISMALEGEQFDRPLTHDLLRLVVERLGAEVDRIVIDDLWQDTFYAKLSLSRGETMVQIDCRPSDAIALAVRARAPIYVAEAVIVGTEQRL